MPHIHVNIKTEGVEKLLKTMDPSKATGPDEIPACIFQMSILLPVVSSLLKNILFAQIMQFLFFNMRMEPLSIWGWINLTDGLEI
jgi:hypothetical protein